MTGGRFVIDTSKCIGCKACQLACQQWNSLTAEDTAFTGSYQNPPDLSGVNLNIVKFKEAEVTGQIRWLFFKDQCRHCDTPLCKLACPKFAIEKLASGIVRIDPTKCVPEGPTACSGTAEKPCQAYCPFHVPKFRYVKNGSPQLQAAMKKCHLCYNRFNNSSLPAASRRPACMVACPTGVMTVGAADSMWTKAVQRAKTLRNHGYPNATIYPHQQGTWGKTHVIWILTNDWRLYDLPGYGYY